MTDGRMTLDELHGIVHTLETTMRNAGGLEVRVKVGDKPPQSVKQVYVNKQTITLVV